MFYQHFGYHIFPNWMKYLDSKYSKLEKLSFYRNISTTCSLIDELFLIWFWMKIEIVNAILKRRIYLFNLLGSVIKAQGRVFSLNSILSKMHLRWKIIYLILIKYFDAIGFSFGHEIKFPCLQRNYGIVRDTLKKIKDTEWTANAKAYHR